MSNDTVTKKDIEEFVRTVLSKDLNHKKITNTMVREIANKVSKTMPVPITKHRKAA